MLRVCSLLVVSALPLAVTAAGAEPYSPVPGVLCDSTFCADEHGVSVSLTRKYAGQEQGERLAAAGEYDPKTFTFRGGVFCEVRERVCREDRYFGADGQRRGQVSSRYTEMLFGGAGRR